MKSMKIASGFAVSALALAIAGQAAAQETTTEVEFTGSVKVQTEVMFEDDTRYSNTAPGLGEYATPGAEGDEDWFNLEATWGVSNGPFSGDLIVGYIDQEDGPRVDIDNLMVEEGPISFGQVGSVADTVGKLEGLTDFDRSEEVGLDNGLDVEAAFRYTVADLGLRIQGEGADGQDFGVGAAIHQDLDVAEVWFDVQYREPVGGDDDVDSGVAVGVAADVRPVDMILLEAAFRNHSLLEDSAYGVKLTVSALEGVSVYGQFASSSVEDEDMAFLVGAEATFAPFTVEGHYAMDVSDGVEDDGLVFGKVSWADGPYSAFAELESDLTLEENGLTLGGMYTTESNIEYGAELDLIDNDDALKMFAQYSF